MLKKEHEGLTVEFVSAKEPVAVVCDGDVDDYFAFRMRLSDCSDKSCGTMVRPIVRVVNKKARMRSVLRTTTLMNRMKRRILGKKPGGKRSRPWWVSSGREARVRSRLKLVGRNTANGVGIAGSA